MPLCIAGMHRSGTSLLTRLLHRCGLYLGPETDLLPASPSNSEGHWENVRFLSLNDAVLARSGSAWNRVQPRDEDWHLDPYYDALRSQAAELTHAFSGREPWGWKDPRNSLTLPFWLQTLPELKVIVCLRHPLEVAESLQARDGIPVHEGLQLWGDYHVHLGKAVAPERRLVVHYRDLLHDPSAELTRVLAFASIAGVEDVLTSALSVPKESMRHHRVPFTALLEPEIPLPVVRDYVSWCAEAGPNSGSWLRADLAPLAGAGTDCSDLPRLLGALAARSVERERQTADAAARLSDRDRQIKTLTARLEEHERQIAHQKGTIEQLTATIHHAANQAEKLRLRAAAVEEQLTWRRHRWASRVAQAYERGRRWFRSAG